MNNYLKAQIDTYCSMVKRGKPAAAVPVQVRYIEEAKNLVKEFNLKYLMENLSEGWKTLWIYKRNHIRKVIKELQQTPENEFDHWVFGKLFGYSEEEIANYISQCE